MGKVALVFPGQGTQYVGMGKDLYDNNNVYKSIVDRACDKLNVDIKDIMFNGSDEELSKTENTQPAIVIHSVGLLETLKSNIEVEHQACLGLSLGEYSALVAAGCIDFEDAVDLVRKRGKIMQNTVPIGIGSMAAVLGMDRNKVEEIISEFKEGTLEVANYNCPGQLVISGNTDNIDKAMTVLKENGAKRVAKLNVSGPFHSSMLDEAGKKLRFELDKININEPKVKVISNVDASYYDNNIKELLTKQVSKSVLWEDSISKLLNEGYDTFIEIGPGKTLKGFIKKIANKENMKCEIVSIEDAKSLETFIDAYKKGSVTC